MLCMVSTGRCMIKKASLQNQHALLAAGEDPRAVELQALSVRKYLDAMCAVSPWSPPLECRHHETQCARLLQSTCAPLSWSEAFDKSRLNAGVCTFGRRRRC